MKDKAFFKYYYSIIFYFIIFSVFSLIFFMYKTILNKKLSSVGNKDCLSKLKIYHDFSWYQKQKKIY